MCLGLHPHPLFLQLLVQQLLAACFRLRLVARGHGRRRARRRLRTRPMRSSHRHRRAAQLTTAGRGRGRGRRRAGRLLGLRRLLLGMRAALWRLQLRLEVWLRETLRRHCPWMGDGDGTHPHRPGQQHAAAAAAQQEAVRQHGGETRLCSWATYCGTRYRHVASRTDAVPPDTLRRHHGRCVRCGRGRRA